MEHQKLLEELLFKGFSISLLQSACNREKGNQMLPSANLPEPGFHFAALLKVYWFFYLEWILSSQNRLEGFTHGMI